MLTIADLLAKPVLSSPENQPERLSRCLLSNGCVELLVSAKVGRILTYRFMDEPNVLWNNSHLTPGMDYIHHGGDKLWPWPQEVWLDHYGYRFPPPREADGMPWRFLRVSPLQAVMVSPTIERLGIFLRRCIELSPIGSKVTITNQLIRSEVKAMVPLAAWSVTQVPMTDSVYVRTIHPAAAAYTPLIREHLGQVELCLPNVLRYQPYFGQRCKIGLEADRLMVVQSGTAFVQTRREKDTIDENRWNAFGEKAQIFASSEPPYAGSEMKPYVELEFASARHSLSEPQTVAALKVEWQLHRLPTRCDRDDLMGILLQG